MSEQPAPVLQLEGVDKRFGSIRAVDDISLSVREGEIVALLGPNGAGKTTLLRLVIGMLRPDRGRIRYRLDGQLGEQPAARRVGYLPEERGLYLDVSVERILVYFAALRGMPRAEARPAAQRWLERLGLAERAGEELRNLSKGNQQKVQFISSIIHRPALAILDEPFSGLDPLNQDFFLGLIRELRAAGTTVVFSAHQMQLVERLADRIVLIRQGRAVSEGTVEELRRQWGAGRLLRLHLEDGADLSFLAGLSGVQRVQRRAESEVELLLEEEVSLSPLLEAIGARLRVRDLRTESLTLHEIYVRTVSGDAAVPAAAEEALA